MTIHERLQDEPEAENDASVMKDNQMEILNIKTGWEQASERPDPFAQENVASKQEKMIQ